MDKLTDRLQGKYRIGPHLPNGDPEFGFRQFQAPPIQHEAAARICTLEAALRAVNRWNDSPSRFSSDLQEILDGALDASDFKYGAG